MAYATTPSASFRAASLSISTLFWAGLLVAMLSVGKQVAQILPVEPGPIQVIEITEPPRPVVTPAPAAPRPTIGETRELSPVPTTPADTTTEPAPLTVEPIVAPTPPLIVRPVWLRRPTSQELQRFYPDRALRRDKEGIVSLDCLVRTDGALACRIAEESPLGWGFGAAALDISQTYRMQPATRDGQAVEARYMLQVPFRLH